LGSEGTFPFAFALAFGALAFGALAFAASAIRPLALGAVCFGALGSTDGQVGRARREAAEVDPADFRSASISSKLSTDELATESTESGSDLPPPVIASGARGTGVAGAGAGIGSEAAGRAAGTGKGTAAGGAGNGSGVLVAHVGGHRGDNVSLLGDRSNRSHSIDAKRSKPCNPVIPWAD
jgi:hypothetical protein